MPKNTLWFDQIAILSNKHVIVNIFHDCEDLKANDFRVICMSIELKPMYWLLTSLFTVVMWGSDSTEMRQPGCFEMPIVTE